MHASEKKSRSLYFSCCLSGQMHGIWFRSAEQGAEFRSCPLQGCRFALLPFALSHFRVSARVTPLSLGTGRQIDGTHKPRRAALRFLWFFSERAGRTAQRAARGFSEKANLGLGIYISSTVSVPAKTTEPALTAQLCAVGLLHFTTHKSKPLKNGRVRPCGICSKDTADQIEGTARTL